MANPNSNNPNVLQSLEELVQTVQCLSGKLNLLTQKPCVDSQTAYRKTVLVPYARRSKDQGHEYSIYTAQSSVCKKRLPAPPAVEMQCLQVPRRSKPKASRCVTSPRPRMASSVECQTERETREALCPTSPSPQVMELRLKVENTDSSCSSVDRCGGGSGGRGPLITLPSCLHQCYGASDQRVVTCMEQLRQEMRDLTRAVVNAPRYQYGGYYSDPMAYGPPSPPDRALLCVTRSLNERLCELGRMMHHMADQYPPLPQGDQRPGGVLADAAIACILTGLKDNMEAVARGLRTVAVKKPAPLPSPCPVEQKPSRERLEVGRLLAEVTELLGRIGRDFREATTRRGNNQEFGDCISQIVPTTCSRPSSPQTCQSTNLIPSICVQPCLPRSGERGERAPAADPVIAAGPEEPEEPEEQEEEEKMLHFEPAPPAQTDCGETMCTAASLPGKTCAPVCRSMKSQGSDRTGCKKPVGCSGVSQRRKGRKLTGLPKKPEPNSGEKRRLQGGSEVLKAVPVSSGQSSSLEEEVPVEVISPPNAIRTGTEKSSSRCAESCSLQRGPSKCLTRKRTTASSAAQSPKSELKPPSRTQQDDNSLEKIKEKGQRASGGAVLKTPTHGTNKMDESTLPRQKRALRENSQLESPLKAPFLGEIQAGVNTVLCGQPSPDKGPFGTEVNYAEMCRTGVLSGVPFSDKDLEEDYLSCLSQKGEQINQTQAQLSKKVASAREQLASILDLLERTDQQDYTEEEFLREVQKLNLDLDFPVTPSYYATSLPRPLPLTPGWDSPLVRPPASTTSASARLGNAAPNARTPAIDSRQARPQQGNGVDPNTDDEAASRRSQGAPSAVGNPKGRRSEENSDASLNSANNTNRQKDVQEADLSNGSARKYWAGWSVKRSFLGGKQPGRTENLPVVEPSTSRLPLLAEKKAASNETEVGGGPSAVPRIMIASESSQGLPEAPVEKSNSEGEDGKPLCEGVSEEAASSGPILRVIDCRPIPPALRKSTGSGRSSRNPSPNPNSDNSFLCKDPCESFMFQQVLRDYYELLARTGGGAKTCCVRCFHREPHLNSEYQNSRCCCTGADDWRPICSPPAYKECSERQSSGCECRPCGSPDIYPPLRRTLNCPPCGQSTDCEHRPCRSLDVYPPPPSRTWNSPECGECSEGPSSPAICTGCHRRPCITSDICPTLSRTRKYPVCEKCSERHSSGANCTGCDHRPSRTSDYCSTPCRTLNCPGVVNLPEANGFVNSGVPQDVTCFKTVTSESGWSPAKPVCSGIHVDPCQRKCLSARRSTLNPTLTHNFRSSTTRVMENEDLRNENEAELCGFDSITDGDIEGPGLGARSACSNLKFSIDCDVYRRGSTSVNPADESRIKFNVPEMSSAYRRETLVDTDSVGRDRGRSQNEAGSTVFLNHTSVRQSQEKTGSLNEEPPCSSRLSTTQPTGSGQGPEPELRTNCRMDIPEATEVTEATNEERFSRQVSLSQSDVMPPRGSSQSKVPCHTIDTPLRSSDQMELETTSTAQPADVQLMDILDRVGHLVCTSSQPNFLLSDALAVVNASLDARQKARAGMNSTRSSSSPFEDKSCCFQRRIPDTVNRKCSSDYFKVWWLDSPVKMKRRKKKRSRSRLDKYRIAEEKAAALSENGTDQLIRILELLERRDRAETTTTTTTTDEAALREMQTAQWPRLNGQSRTAKAESMNFQGCSPLPTPVQQPINFLVFRPPQPYAQTVGYPVYDPRFQPPSVSVQSTTSANRPSVWPGPRQTTASWFTAPPSSDWFSALVGGYGGLGGYNPQPLSLSTRNSASKGEKHDSSNEENA